MVLACGEKMQYVFLAKLNSKKEGSPHKSKVKKSDCIVTLGNKQHSIIASNIEDE